MPHGSHGGSYPYASLNTAGNTATNDYCMAVGVLAKGSTAHGWLQASTTGLKNDCASQCPAVTIVGSGAGSFKMEASSREKNSPSLK